MQDERSPGWHARLNNDYYGGGLILFVGLAAVWKGFNYQVGSLSHMGPGYFPVGVGAVLALMGACVVAGAVRRSVTVAHEPGRAVHPPEWRGWFCIILAGIAFIVLGHWGGLVPATFAVTFIAALGDRQNTFKTAFLLALAMVAVAIIVFSWALQMQFPLFRWG
ncbi:tripartite tricarboxylate transporter TctB family protein [Noviherbaspirillum pedocola]|uniref:Tripartite tricarboxylate transporter TctB family protein n=1 Tax=Noviherbaspirillum pedocola TaxID=2801341 RepID=A0A934T0Y8_9BURK|nr:tripartite tricarboxylate transporter TctB family protein [Noviherbaspirillum pedocola]MBK4739025.1 tripartite tricarboxylate transporter TctB family protein [Noviherbaspirillum pedocola]